jgi:hypothetical protein
MESFLDNSNLCRPRSNPRMWSRIHIDEVDALFQNCLETLLHLIENLDFITASNWYPPKAGRSRPFHVIEKLVVGRLEGFPSALLCNLHRLAASCPLIASTTTFAL